MMNRQKLSSDEIEDQRELMSKLQWLLSTLSEAGILPTGNSKGKPVILVDETPPEPPKDPPTKDLPRGFDPTDNGEELHPLTKGLRPSGPGVGLNSFAVHAVLPQPKRIPRSPNLDSKVPTWKPDAKVRKHAEEQEHLFEAYYIIPRSVPRTQPRGQIQLTKPITDDYMVICLDTKQDYHKDPNLRNALRRAKRAPDSVMSSIVNQFPRSVQDAAFSLASHRKRHANGLTWSLVEGVELRCLEESMFRKSLSKTGFLVVFRGSGSRKASPKSLAPLPSILKGSTNHQRNRSLPVSIEHNERGAVTGRESQAHSPSSSYSLGVSFKTSKKDKKKNGKAKETSPPSPEPTPDPADNNPWMDRGQKFDKKGGKEAKMSKALVELTPDAVEEPKTDDIWGMMSSEKDKKNHRDMPVEVVNECQVEKPDTTLKGDVSRRSAEWRLTSDYFGPSARPGPFTDGSVSPGSLAGTNRGVPLSPHSPGDIATPVDTDLSQEPNQEDSDEDSTIITRRPTFSEPKAATTDDLRLDSVSSAPKDRKGKAKVEFETAALLKSERPITRPLPGPVLYDPARSKLLPSPQSPLEQQHSTAPSSHRRRSSAPFVSTTVPSQPQSAVPQRPQSYYPGTSYYPAAAPQSRPLSERFAPRPPISHSAYSSYSPPAAYTMAPPPPPGWTASSRPSSSMRRPVTHPIQSGSNEHFSEKLQQAHAYQEDVAGPTPTLTAEFLKRQQRRQPGSSRSTKSSASRDESDYRKSATTRTKWKSSESNSDDEDVTVKVKGAAPSMLGDDAEGDSPPGRASQDPARPRPVIVDERPMRPRRRQSGSSGSQPTRQHRKEKIVMVERRDSVEAVPSRTNNYLDRHRSSAYVQHDMPEQAEPSNQDIQIMAEEEADRQKRAQAEISAAVKSESERRRDQRIAQQDREIRRRPAVPLQPRSHLRPGGVAYDDGTKSEEKDLGRSSRRTSLPTRPYSSTPSVLYELSGSEDELEGTDDEEPYSRGEQSKAQAQLRAAEEQHLRAEVQQTAEAGVVRHLQNKPPQRSGESSTSRVRTGSAIASTGLAGAAVAGLYENRKAKEDTEEEAERGSDSEPTISDFSSVSGNEDEDSTVVEERKEDNEGEELHLTQNEAQAMMMNFLATFTTV